MKRLRERARALSTVRAFFDSRDFVEVQTPVVVPSPGLDVHLDAFEVVGGDSRRTSLACHLSRVPDEAPPGRTRLAAPLPDRSVLPPRRGGRPAQPRVHDARVVPRACGDRRRHAGHRAARRRGDGRRRPARRSFDRRAPPGREAPGLRGVRALRGMDGGGDTARGGARRRRVLPRARRPGRARDRAPRPRGIPRGLSRHAGVARAAQARRPDAGRALRSSMWPAWRCATVSGSSSTPSNSASASTTDRAESARATFPTTLSTNASSRPSGACRPAEETRSVSTGSWPSPAARRRSPTSSPLRPTTS